MKNRPLAPHGGNDDVMTPDYLAAQIVNHFKPTGKCLEPCKGSGAFYNILPNCDYFEIKEGRDFLISEPSKHYFPKQYDWVLTNPPWSQIRPFLQKSMSYSTNIVFLCLVNAFFMKARLRDMEEYNFGFREILFIDTPPKPWPQTGFQLGAIHIQYNCHYAVRIGKI